MTALNACSQSVLSNIRIQLLFYSTFHISFHPLSYISVTARFYQDTKVPTLSLLSPSLSLIHTQMELLYTLSIITGKVHRTGREID